MVILEKLEPVILHAPHPILNSFTPGSTKNIFHNTQNHYMHTLLEKYERLSKNVTSEVPKEQRIWPRIPVNYLSMKSL